MKKLLSVLLYVSAIFFCLEATLYFLDIPKDYEPHTFPPQFQESSNEDIVYTNLPSASIDFVYDRNPRGYFHAGNVVEHVTNSDGFRGPEIKKPKLPDTYRVLFFGDSFIFGEGVYWQDIVSEKFRAIANDNNLFGKSVETIDLGVSGYNTAQEYRLLKAVTEEKMSPDLVIVGYTMNDADSPLFSFSRPKHQFLRKDTTLESIIIAKMNEPLIFKMFRSLRIIRDWYMGKVISDRTLNYYHDLYTAKNPNWQLTREAIAEFGKYQKNTGTKVVFVIFPMLADFSNYPLVEEEALIRRELESNGLDYINLRDKLSGFTGPELWVHPTDRHPNEIVHKIAAQALADYFSAQK